MFSQVNFRLDEKKKKRENGEREKYELVEKFAHGQLLHFSFCFVFKKKKKNPILISYFILFLFSFFFFFICFPRLQYLVKCFFCCHSIFSFWRFFFSRHDFFFNNKFRWLYFFFFGLFVTFLFQLSIIF